MKRGYAGADDRRSTNIPRRWKQASRGRDADIRDPARFALDRKLDRTAADGAILNHVMFALRGVDQDRKHLATVRALDFDFKQEGHFGHSLPQHGGRFEGVVEFSELLLKSHGVGAG